MIKDITFGQYYQTSSLLHKLDPRIKLVLTLLQIIFVFISNNTVSLLLMLFVVIFEIFMSRVPVKMYLKNLKAILPILVFTMIFNLFYGTGTVIFSFWIFSVTKDAIFRTVFLLIRIVILIIAGAMLTYTTSPNDLTDGIERLFSPLRFIGLKSAVHTLAMMMTIALRFIPTLVEETEKIINAQKARGADFEGGNLKTKINSLIPILIPLLISAIRRAYELAEAMECRCYTGCEGRVRMKQFHLSFHDLAASLFLISVCVAVILSNCYLNNIIWSF
ncbi:MAG: energy-coupling factor transporter transmembrane protein EcfT [Clostridia bacterium]|nr:energy-coupling factor transporter transmembrane protein EcfT [Clostridia bacterium]